MNNTNNFSARESYNIARQILFNAFKDDPAFQKYSDPQAACWEWVNGRKMSQGEIRLEVQLNAINNSFKFAMTANQSNTNGVIFNTERRLDLQDTLIASEMGFFTGQPSSQTDTTWDLKTFGNPFTFGATDGALLDSTLYSHGYFEMKVNNDVVMPYRGLFNHQYRPQTQQTAAVGAGSPKDQIKGSEDGFITTEPNLLLIGSKGYVPMIYLPTALGGTFTYTRAVLIFRGINAQNSTAVS